jgi:beta-mannosidase
LTLPLEALLATQDAKRVFLVSELVEDGKIVSNNEHFFQPFKNLSLPQAKISAQAMRTREGFRITLFANKLARTVYLSAPDQKGVFADNYFDLIPGKKVDVEYRTTSGVKAADFQKALKVRSLVDAF